MIGSLKIRIQGETECTFARLSLKYAFAVTPVQQLSHCTAVECCDQQNNQYVTTTLHKKKPQRTTLHYTASHYIAKPYTLHLTSH